jgi:hypothetical protein
VSDGGVWGAGTNWAEAVETFPAQAFAKVFAVNVQVGDEDFWMIWSVGCPLDKLCEIVQVGGRWVMITSYVKFCGLPS